FGGRYQGHQRTCRKTPVSRTVGHAMLGAGTPSSQNIRTHLLAGCCVSTIIRTSACLPLHYHPYSASMWSATAEGEGDGLETPAGIHHGDGRSGTAATQRISGHGKSHLAQPDHGPCAVE